MGGARHEVDSLYQVVQLVPDWESKFRDAFNDPLRQQGTQASFAPLKRAVEEILQGADAFAALERALAELNKPRN
jgi:hypothetical protein